MLRALAAELSDPGRYSRAKAYARDGAVIDIDIRPQTVTGLVLGSRRQPYEVLLAADAGQRRGDRRRRPGGARLDDDARPGREELSVACTCPDAAGVGGGLCKHAVALLLVLADETTIEPELLVRWRSPDPDDRVRALDAHRLPGRGRTRAPVATRVDVLAGLLDGATTATGTAPGHPTTTTGATACGAHRPIGSADPRAHCRRRGGGQPHSLTA